MAEGREAPGLNPCPLCRGSAQRLVSRRGRDGRPLDTALCRGCGHVFNTPVPSEADLRTYYHQAYRSTYKGVARPKAKHVLRAGRRALERLSQLRSLAATSARVLDIGAGGGEFVYLAARAGFAARGIEPHQGYADQARTLLGVDVVHGALQDVRIPDESADVATLHHVLEHLPDPLDALRRIWRLLTPGGLLMVEVPNVESWYHAPHRRFHAAHIHAFHRAGLENLIKNAGFAIVTSELTPHTQHLAISARRSDPPGLATWTNDADRIENELLRHTPIAHVMSGRPLRRLWANLKRPIGESWAMLRLGSRDPRAILDHLWTETNT